MTSRSNWRRPFAAFLTLWPLVSPTGFVGAAIHPAAADADYQALLEAGADCTRVKIWKIRDHG